MDLWLTSLVLVGVLASFRVEAQEQLFVRLPRPLASVKKSPQKQVLAFVDASFGGLYTIDLKSQEVFKVSDVNVGAGYFWLPDGQRLIFREIYKEQQEPHSKVAVFDGYQNRVIPIAEYPELTGFPTLDPRDYHFYVMHSKGFYHHALHFPDKRFARWQVRQRTDLGFWVVAQKGVTYLTNRGLNMTQLPDDGSLVASYDISPDGKMMAWSTEAGYVYMSDGGKAPVSVGRGADPVWHPETPHLLYAGGRLVGDTIVNYDLRLCDTKLQCEWVTATQNSDERWPVWSKAKQIYYTKSQTTDLYVMDLR